MVQGTHHDDELTSGKQQAGGVGVMDTAQDGTVIPEKGGAVPLYFRGPSIL